MTRHDTPTTPARCPDERDHDCGALDVCGTCRGLWPRCGCDARPRTTAPLPPPDAVAAYVAKRAAIAALRADCDALWDAMGESDHDRVVTTLESLGLVG